MFRGLIRVDTYINNSAFTQASPVESFCSKPFIVTTTVHRCHTLRELLRTPALSISLSVIFEPIEQALSFLKVESDCQRRVVGILQIAKFFDGIWQARGCRHDVPEVVIYPGLQTWLL